MHYFQVKYQSKKWFQREEMHGLRGRLSRGVGYGGVLLYNQLIENCWNNNRMLCTNNLLALDSKLDFIRFIKL